MSVNSEKPSFTKLFDPSDIIPDIEIENVTREALCFRENLIVSLKDELTSDTKPLGGYCISLESIGTEGNEFMIQVLSSFSMNDCLAGSKVLSSITAKFHCLEEKRTEYIINHDDKLREKVLYIGLEDDVYHLEGKEICICDKSTWKKDLPLCSNGEIISEGANVLLMRYLAVKNFHGSLSFQSIMIGGQLTTCNYRCTEARRMEFNGHIAEVYTVERRMHEECGLVHNVKTQMTRKGYILSHEWLEVPYLLQINSLIDPNEIDNKRPRIIDPLRSWWSSDVQMMSMYLDKKTCKMAQQVEYLTDHPEIKQLISDYTQTLLAVKPINVLSFTIQHFAAFAKNPDPAKIDTSGQSNMDIMSQLSGQTPKRVCSVCGICSNCLMSEHPPLDSECDHVARTSRYPLPDQEQSKYSLCSVFSKCPSDATCVTKLSGNSSTTAPCFADGKVCKSDEKNKNSICSFYPNCKETCDGCRPLREPCTVHKACPECPGCHNVCSEIDVCPNCEKCNIEILPDTQVSGCIRSGAENMKKDVNASSKE